jgi:bifunctional enzyme CysN/CysC
LNSNLGFSPEDRVENVRRIGEVAALFARAGFIAVASFISPYRADRDSARAAAKNNFHEVYVKASIEDCEKRDPKGLYRKARAGEIENFTGISAPYEEPIAAELVVDTCSLEVAQGVSILSEYIEKNFSL